MSIKLSIVILNYNTSILLKQALESIKTKVKHEIIVVDNASLDDSVEMLEKHFPKVKVIQITNNRGFAAGNNVGIKASQGEYVMLLNSDTQVIDDALDKLVHFMDQHPTVGILSPKILLTDGAIDLSCHRGFPTITNSLAYFMKLEQIFPTSKLFAGYHQTWKDFDQSHEVDAVSGAAMVIRRQVIEDVGLLDERFFMYAEDIDLCYRAKKKQWSVMYYPFAKILHFKGASGTKNADTVIKNQTKYHFYHTMKQYFEKHYSHKYPKPVLWAINKSIDVVAWLKK